LKIKRRRRRILLEFADCVLLHQDHFRHFLVKILKMDVLLVINEDVVQPDGVPELFLGQKDAPVPVANHPLVFFDLKRTLLL
jgi:hypothetical protein